MKNNLMRATVFIVLGTCLLIVSIFTKNSKVELWSSFFLGLSLPIMSEALFRSGIISDSRNSKYSKDKPVLQN
ncbi:MAG: hypothetical protein ACHQHN_15060 [Sphingobacteriales bacterium]